MSMIRIKDFNDFNYERIAFRCDYLSEEFKKALLEKLKKDYINKLYRLKNATYFAIWNCDLQDFATVDDIYFDSCEHDYTLANLAYMDGEIYYRVVDSNMKVREELWI